MKFELAQVIGHRGACGHAPENTLSSMSKAQELGVKWVEFDVMLAGCGEPIIIHDTTLDRTTNGSGEIAQVDYCTIANLDCGSWFAPSYSGETVPTLTQLLDHLASLNLAMNIEIKPTQGFDVETTLKTLTTLEKEWPSTLTPPLVSSFSKKVLEVAEQFDFPLGLVIDSWETDWLDALQQHGCISLHVDQKILSQAKVKQIRDKGYLVLAYTVNEPSRAQELFTWGVDSVFSDFPDRIIRM